MSSSSITKAEKINRALFEISQAISSTPNVNSVYKEIRSSLGNVMDVSNFYIALLDQDSETARFEYYIDEQDSTFNVDRTDEQADVYEVRVKLTKGSMTTMVVQSEQPLMITQKELLDFCTKNHCKPAGTPPKIWLGAPIKSGDKLFGVLAVQNYRDEQRYDTEDLSTLTSVGEQLAIAIQRKQYEEVLKCNELRYQDLVENINEVIYSTDAYGKFRVISPAVKSLTGFAAHEILHELQWYRFSPSDDTPSSEQLYSDIIHKSDRQKVSRILSRARDSKGRFELEYRIIAADGKERWVYDKGHFLPAGASEVRLEGIIINIHDRKKLELINQTLFEVSNAVSTTTDLQHLYRAIHSVLGKVIDLSNFFIAFYDRSNDRITFPFDMDERNNDEITHIPNASRSPSLTAEVIRTKKPLLVDRQQAYDTIKEFGSDFIGDPPEQWLGVPLIAQGEVIGAMVTQSYADPVKYNDKDIEVLLSVSEQVAIAITRKRYEEEMLAKELQLSTLFDITNAIITTFNMDELYASIHNSLKRIIDVENFGIALHDWDNDVMNYVYIKDVKMPERQFTIRNASQSTSLAYEVVKREEVVYFGRKETDAFIRSKGGNRIGYPSESWLGIPLKGKNRTLGAIVIQNYEQTNRFHPKDIELLFSVSGQIAFAIERKQAETDLAETQRELIEYAHKVGMADIANATLHNVGNILNSVKTSTEVIDRINRDSYIDYFKEANILLKSTLLELDPEHPRWEKSQQLLEYYRQLEKRFEEEKHQIQEQVDRLNDKIKLMTDVIITQQGTANASFMTGTYSLEPILEDVLMMQSESLHRYQIQVHKDFDRIPQVYIQKTKLIHILINLINNARDSMKDIDRENRHLFLALKLSQEGVLIQIRDTGQGISKENLGKIFTHGFTTKTTGHGFGLHNSALYLEEMNGKIWVDSEGVGKGAVFTISLPVDLKSENHVPDLNTKVNSNR